MNFCPQMAWPRATVLSLPACSHGGQRTRVNQTLPHVPKLAIFQHAHSEFGGCLPLKHWAKKLFVLGVLWQHRDLNKDIFGTKRTTGKFFQLQMVPHVPPNLVNFDPQTTTNTNCIRAVARTGRRVAICRVSYVSHCKQEFKDRKIVSLRPIIKK